LKCLQYLNAIYGRLERVEQEYHASVEGFEELERRLRT